MTGGARREGERNFGGGEGAGWAGLGPKRGARGGEGGRGWAANRLGRLASAGPTVGRERGERPAGQLGRARGGGWAEMGGEGEREKKKVFLFLKSIFL
jgi:hypothetical protein